jgi:hypothetical protein
MQQLTRLQNKKTAFCIGFIVLSFSFFISCNDKQEPAQTPPVQVKSESFTFFDLGINTELTKNARKELGEKLGRDAIEHRSIIDLEINYRGFLKKYFSDLDELNRRLNFPPGERVEHHTIKLMYRYAQKENVPFEYVELVFSGYTKTPLLFRIIFRKDEANIVETLKTKYGRPMVVDWKEENGKSLSWKKNMDYLIVSLVPDQFGIHEYQIVIYYVENLKQLIETEKNEQEKREKERTQSGKRAF